MASPESQNKSPESAGVKILIDSGYAAADEATGECIKLGAKGFVAKPYRFKELLQQIFSIS